MSEIDLASVHDGSVRWKDAPAARQRRFSTLQISLVSRMTASTAPP